MARWMVALAATGALAGCATADGAMAPDMAAGGAMMCKVEGAQSQVGQKATQAVAAAILKDSGARTLRWGPPNGAWTMDYREDRVNVRYDEAMTITEITFG